MRNLARRHGRDPAGCLTLYALERFLARLAASEYASDFVLKGGVLMAALGRRRPTRDVDLAAAGLSNDVDDVERRVGNIAGMDLDDGLVFDHESIVSQVIREASGYTGVRVKLVARVATARLTLHVDVNFGDPIWPSPTYVLLPLLLGGTLRLVGYPDHMVLAEKIVTAVERGEQNTRWRDFIDVATIASTRSIRADDLRAAVDAVARYRQVRMGPLGPLVVNMPHLAQRKWQIWRRKQKLQDVTPAGFDELLDRCVTFADPVLSGAAGGLVWWPEAQGWDADAGPVSQPPGAAEHDSIDGR